MIPTHRFDIIQKADGRIYVDTINLETGCGAMLHHEYFYSVEEAKAEIARQKAKMATEAKASKEVLLGTEIYP